jgi:hypothetical protein
VTVYTPEDTDERRREFTRWRISAEFAIPLDRVTGDTEEEMRRSAATKDHFNHHHIDDAKGPSLGQTGVEGGGGLLGGIWGKVSEVFDHLKGSLTSPGLSLRMT